MREIHADGRRLPEQRKWRPVGATEELGADAERMIGRMTDDAATVSDALALVFVVQSIERVGDHSKNVAEYVVHVVSGVDPRHNRLELAGD
jgi:hypothetical protein